MSILYSTTFDVVCSVCKKVVWHGEIGEYPWSWQFVVCSCGGQAHPDMDSSVEHWTTDEPDYHGEGTA